ncbi:MAG: dihydroxyacetone kinase subunit L [Eubacteriales bacterium]|nr:dihydroxyacetone kinase subunit L [Eubacteriales bacterium]
MKEFDISKLKGMFDAVAENITAHADELCEMDAKMGDGDLGLTMKKGFSALPGLLDEIQEENFGKKIAKAGMKMSSVVPSTMGTLMSSGLMNAGKAISDLSTMDANGLLRYLEAFAEGIAKRGKCARGDRTVLDSVSAAAEKLKAALEADPSMEIGAAAAVALQGAEEGTEETRNMEPKFGKAAVHKAAAAGQRDQGACAGLYMIEGMANYLQKI